LLLKEFAFPANLLPISITERDKAFSSLGSGNKGCPQAKDIGAITTDDRGLQFGQFLICAAIGILVNSRSRKGVKFRPDLLKPLFLLRGIGGISTNQHMKRLATAIWRRGPTSACGQRDQQDDGQQRIQMSAS